MRSLSGLMPWGLTEFFAWFKLEVQDKMSCCNPLGEMFGLWREYLRSEKRRADAGEETMISMIIYLCMKRHRGRKRHH